MSLLAGRSVEGRPLVARRHGPDGDRVLTFVFGGIHGDEPGAVAVVELLDRALADHPPSAPILVAPACNPDGLAADRKDNARGVDLNRNFPSRNWSPTHPPGYFPGSAPLSEPESAWLAALISDGRPERIVAVHQPFACVNYDGPAATLAARMAAACGWPVVADIGYPTPGSFGSCYGVDAGLEVITLELPRPASDADLASGLAALHVACRR